MNKKPTMSKNQYSIRELIEKGKSAVREYELPIGKILIRPLSDIEIEECEAVLFDLIKDEATREYVFDTAAEELMELDENGDESKVEKTKEIDPEKLKKIEKVNFGQLFSALNELTIRIVYTSTKDFFAPGEEISMDELKCLDGLKECAREIQRISGYNEKTRQEIENFREQSEG